jgi:lysophospholipase L1-like esterase
MCARLGRLAAVGLLTAGWALPAGAADVLIPADDANIHYYGRFDFSDPKAPRFNWSGTTIEFAVTGTATVGMQMADGVGYYDVEVDGALQAPPVNANSAAAKRYDLASGLAAGTHVIRVIRRNEPYPGIATFGGIFVAEGGKLAALPEPARKMEFVGDSWTAGYYNEACTDQQANTNTNKAWARLVSKAFHAQDVILAESGIGLARSLGGKAVMPKKYLGTFDTLVAGMPAPLWGFGWKPDIVSVFLGINDKNAGASEADFTAALHAFVTTLRSHYPDAAILFISATGSMDRAAKSAVAAETTSLGHKRVYWQECKTVGSGCQYHPTLAQDREIANAMIPGIAQITGWDTAQAPMPLGRKRTGLAPAGRLRVSRGADGALAIAGPAAAGGLPILALSADGRIESRLTLDAAGEGRWQRGQALGPVLIGGPKTGWTLAPGP